MSVSAAEKGFGIMIGMSLRSLIVPLELAKVLRLMGMGCTFLRMRGSKGGPRPVKNQRPQWTFGNVPILESRTQLNPEHDTK